MENPLLAVLVLIGSIVTVMLFVLFYRNRKQDRLTRRRFLVLFVLMLVHTLLYHPAFGGETIFLAKFWAALWIFSFPLFLIVMIIYFVHFNEWNNHDLRVATSLFAGYTMLILLSAFFSSCFMATT